MFGSATITEILGLGAICLFGAYVHYRVSVRRTQTRLAVCMLEEDDTLLVDELERLVAEGKIKKLAKAHALNGKSETHDALLPDFVEKTPRAKSVSAKVAPVRIPEAVVSRLSPVFPVSQVIPKTRKRRKEPAPPLSAPLLQEAAQA